MKPLKTSKFLEIAQELDNDERIDDLLKGRERRRPEKRLSARERHFLYSQDDSRRTFEFTYPAARYEQAWLLDSLGGLYEQRWISDVLRKVRTGKEASVYLCRAGERAAPFTPLVAAKVYRPRMLRSLRNDALYREGRLELDEDGREVQDRGMLHAVFNRTRFGEQVRHQSWIAYEYTALQTLHAAGVDVPRPYEMAHNAILMDYLGEENLPAPTLQEVELEPGQAGALFARLLKDLERMLDCGLIHGDLSAYNVLYWEGRAVLIDFPQVISPKANRSARAILQRDLARLCAYFNTQGLSLHAQRLAEMLWQAHGLGLCAPRDPDPPEEEDPPKRAPGMGIL